MSSRHFIRLVSYLSRIIQVQRVVFSTLIYSDAEKLLSFEGGDRVCRMVGVWLLSVTVLGRALRPKLSNAFAYSTTQMEGHLWLIVRSTLMSLTDSPGGSIRKLYSDNRIDNFCRKKHTILWQMKIFFRIFELMISHFNCLFQSKIIKIT